MRWSRRTLGADRRSHRLFPPPADTGTPSRRSVLVVGATGALGGALVRALAEDGWTVGIAYRSSSSRAQALADELEDGGHDAWIAGGDVADANQARSLIAQSPPLDGVVYAAGPRIRLDYIANLSSEEFSDAVDADLKACFNLFSAALPVIRERSGAMLALSTMAATRYATRDILSAVPKAGVEMLVKAIALEEGRFGVRCNAVSPGPIEGGAGIWEWFVEQGFYDDGALEAARRQIPLRLFGLPEDIAHAGAFLMSPRARLITGQVLCVDGGYSVA